MRECIDALIEMVGRIIRDSFIGVLLLVFFGSVIWLFVALFTPEFVPLFMIK